MTGLQPEAPVSNTCDGSGPVAAARENLAKAAVAPVERAAEAGLAANVATLYRNDPLEAETAFRDIVLGMARNTGGVATGGTGGFVEVAAVAEPGWDVELSRSDGVTFCLRRS